MQVSVYKIIKANQPMFSIACWLLNKKKLKLHGFRKKCNQVTFNIEGAFMIAQLS